MTYDRKVLVDVLVHHWPTATAGCRCGWAVLGASFPEHVADVYEDAVDGEMAELREQWTALATPGMVDGIPIEGVRASVRSLAEELLHRTGGP